MPVTAAPDRARRLAYSPGPQPRSMTLRPGPSSKVDRIHSTDDGDERGPPRGQVDLAIKVEAQHHLADVRRGPQPIGGVGGKRLRVAR